MAAIYLTESDVGQLLSMRMALDAIETVFRKHAMTEISNIPRGRAQTDRAMLHLMGAAAKSLGVMACKVYTSSRLGARFLVHLYDGDTGDLLALIQAERLGAIRTGAATGVATSHMSRPDSTTVGVFGSGTQARTQLEAICMVRSIVEAYVYSPNVEHRETFASEMSAITGIKVVGVPKPELAAQDKDILVTATNSVEPVIHSSWIREGTHLNAVGSNFLGRSELDAATIARCDPIVVDDKEQARGEAGDFVRAMDDGMIRWSDIIELGNVVVGRSTGRHPGGDLTLFKSVGVAFEDAAVAKVVYDEARLRGVGSPLPF